MGSFSRMTCTMGPAGSQDGAITCVFFRAGMIFSSVSDMRDVMSHVERSSHDREPYNNVHTEHTLLLCGNSRGCSRGELHTGVVGLDCGCGLSEIENSNHKTRLRQSRNLLIHGSSQLAGRADDP